MAKKRWEPYIPFTHNDAMGWHFWNMREHISKSSKFDLNLACAPNYCRPGEMGHIIVSLNHEARYMLRVDHFKPKSKQFWELNTMQGNWRHPLDTHVDAHELIRRIISNTYTPPSTETLQ